MSEIPSELLYTESHEWASQGADGIVSIGITDYAQTQLGDLVFVEPPQVDETLARDTECGVVESVKTASDIKSPVAGVVTQVNDALTDAPEIINNDPYGDGWVYRVRPDGDLSHLMNAEAYTALVKAKSE